jgi:hypothetical protein
MKKKICSKCKEEKDVCEFSKDKSKNSGYKSQCKDCVKITHSKYKSLNPEKLIMTRKKYNKKNSEKILTKTKEYYEKNKVKIISKLNDKYKNNPLYRMKVNLRKRISFYLKSKNLIKTNKTFDIIGCSPEFLKGYLEKKFTDGMCWELVGHYIHIDHIIPLSSAKTEKELIKLCHYTNLQPLWSEDNLRKSNKII